MLENIALFACEGGAVETCSPSDLFGALQGIASRAFPGMKLHATMITGAAGRDVQQEVTDVLNPYWDQLPRQTRRELRRELVETGIHEAPTTNPQPSPTPTQPSTVTLTANPDPTQLLGVELIRSEGVFNRQLAVQGGVVVDSIKMASSCFGQTAATLDPQLVLADYLAHAKVSLLPILETV